VFPVELNCRARSRSELVPDGSCRLRVQCVHTLERILSMHAKHDVPRTSLQNGVHIHLLPRVISPCYNPYKRNAPTAAQRNRNDIHLASIHLSRIICCIKGNFRLHRAPGATQHEGVWMQAAARQERSVHPLLRHGASFSINSRHSSCGAGALTLECTCACGDEASQMAQLPAWRVLHRG
jgi:hypothetical protein